MGAKSKRKGANGERSLAQLLCDEGFPATRGVQYHGGEDSPDVRCPSLPWVHFECKRTERLNLYAALEQAKQDAWPSPMPQGPVKFPVVAHRKNGEEWVAILRLVDLLQILRESSYVEPTVADALRAIDGTIEGVERVAEEETTARTVERSRTFGAEPEEIA